ncbi:hypothetical protein [Cohnella candidum]|uniref:DUF4367 domain-containing protein n=1 Tax=Cohnella candidum TaxID=2674991 RepID=A0A3G3K3P9_9BACL|nr:hypothetical protein [Cohnella candidum]AYQ74781.1 hypothetical protein EAV92_20840 [Cohnella candidum]
MRIRVSELFEEPLPATDGIELRNDSGTDSERIKQMVMGKIGETATCDAPVLRRPLRQKRVTIGIALIALSVMLLSGFTYALTSGLLTIKDDNGRVVMQVQKPNTIIPAEQKELEDRIRKTIHDRLRIGEGALILVGQQNIDAVRRYQEPKRYLSTYRGHEYSSTQDVSSRLVGHLSGMKKLGDRFMDAKISKVEMVPNLSHPNAVPLDKWVEATDTASGNPYAYYKFNADERAYLDDTVIIFSYRSADSTFRLMGNAGDFTSFEVFDQNPSAERIHEAGGIPIYQIDGQNGSSLIWRQLGHDGELDFRLTSDADIQKQLDFADAVIKATSEER